MHVGGANVEGSGMISKIIGISLGLMVIAIVYPMALEELAGITTETLPEGTGTLLTVLLPIVAVIGVIMLVLDRS